MKKYLFTYLFIILGALASNADEIRYYTLDIKDFTELKVNNNLNVEYYCSSDSAGHIEFSCLPEVSHLLLFTTNNSSLKIQIADDYDVLPEMPPLRVYSSRLEKVENGADSTIRIISNRPVKSFKSRIIGNGTIIIDSLESESIDLSIVAGKGHILASSGTTVKAKYSNVGTGTIQAGGIKAEQVKVYLSGTGNIDCDASESLTVYGIGSGNVYYSGNPAKVSNRSVGVKAHSMSSSESKEE